ncbi:MAG: DUF1015 family protein [Thermoplasmatota archaeon]
MVEVKPFNGIRPKHPASFCIKPYDVIGDEELRRLRQDDNAIHVILPEGKGDEVYDNARRAFQQAVQENMTRDEPSIYLYRESSQDFTQRGFILAVSLKDYEEGRIKKHEETRKEPLEDRVRHIEATAANTGLVWTVFRSQDRLKQLMDQAATGEPVADFDKYGYRHTLWQLSDSNAIEAVQDAFRDVALYIADGHHRIRAAYEYSKRHDDEEAGYVMVFTASDDETRILPYNRVIRGIDSDSFLEDIKQYFEVSRLEQPDEPDRHEIQLYYQGAWWQLRPRNVPDDMVASLDVSILQRQLLEPVLDITDVRGDPNIFFEGGDLPRSHYEQLVDEKDNAAVFYLHPTSIDDLEAVADKERDMPPKSTWFDPKLLTGLVFHSLR